MKIVSSKRHNKKIVFNPHQHPFHLVPASPGPYILAGIIGNLVGILVQKIHGVNVPHSGCIYCFVIYYLSRGFLTYSIIGGFGDIILEATYEGRHTEAVQGNIRIGFALFIVSEIIFFAAFFFAYFYLAAGPSVEIGCMWPPAGIKTIWTGGLPFVNTIILLSSGITVTWAHKIIASPLARKRNRLKYIPYLWVKGYEYSEEFGYTDTEELLSERPWQYNAREEFTVALALTIILGGLFTYIQLYEYKHAHFSLSTTVYGSLFYVITGFHGLHVLIGTVMLGVCLLRHMYYHFTRDHHIGLELAIWYGHFVDVVGIFLFICLYWWGA